jgi:hypothetical protein
LGASQFYRTEFALKDTVMKRAIFVVIFCLAAASTAAAADDTLSGLIQAGNRDAALKMTAAGADVNAAQGDGTTPLHWAVYKVDADMVRALLARGAKPDVVNNYGSSPLAEAVKVANARLVGMLLDAGSNVEVPNQEGQTALMLAARAFLRTDGGTNLQGCPRLFPPGGMRKNVLELARSIIEADDSPAA